MKITIRAEGNDKDTELVFSNDQLNNYNFVDILTDDNCYTVSLTDLDGIVEAFKVQREDDKL